MHVLIIGGTGLISTAITRELVERGDRVTLYNRGKSDADVPSGTERIVGDRTEYAKFERQMADAGLFDCVVDMVCFAPSDAESALRAFKGRVGQYIFCSTVDVYTKPAARYPIIEDAERAPSPSFPYAFNKAACERIFEAAYTQDEFPVTIIRPAHTYGEGGSLVFTFGWGTHNFDRIRKGKPLIVHGDGKSLWSTCHRDDVGRAFIGAVANEDTIGQAYHVAGQGAMTWDQYYQGIAEAMNAPEPTLVHIPTDLLGRIAPRAAEWCVKNFQYDNVFDNGAAMVDLGFRQTIPWVKGVRRVVDWLDAYGDIDDSDDYPEYDQIVDAWQRLSERMKRELAGRNGLEL